ncbi:MAG: radical SAM protein [Thermoplasmatota archaeon]
MKIRVSSGTAMYIGLKKGKALEVPTTAYLMIPGDVCRGGCVFCPQSKGKKEWLSRVSWPKFILKEVVEKIKTSDLERICLQSPDIPRYEKKIINTIKELKKAKKPVSISSPPLTNKTLRFIKNPVDHIGVGIDGATDEVRKNIKPNYNPKLFWDYLGRAKHIYGAENVTAHVIVGIGEDIEELASLIKKIDTLGCRISLFPYYSKEEGGPDLKYYRRAQLLVHMIKNDERIDTSLKTVKENPENMIEDIEKGEIFLTNGCPSCNRPFYTTRPGKEHRNFPRLPSKKELEKIKKDLNITGGE